MASFFLRLTIRKADLCLRAALERAFAEAFNHDAKAGFHQRGAAGSTSDGGGVLKNKGDARGQPGVDRPVGTVGTRRRASRERLPLEGYRL